MRNSTAYVCNEKNIRTPRIKVRGFLVRDPDQSEKKKQSKTATSTVAGVVTCRSFQFVRFTLRAKCMNVCTNAWFYRADRSRPGSVYVACELRCEDDTDPEVRDNYVGIIPH